MVKFSLILFLSINAAIQVNSFSTPRPALTHFQHNNNSRIKPARTTTPALWMKTEKGNGMKEYLDKNDDDNNSKRDNFFAKLTQMFNLTLNDIIFMVENQSRKTRLVANRAYSSDGAFKDENLYNPPSLKDFAPPPAELKDTFWMSLPSVFLSFMIPFLSFPYLVQVLDYYVTIGSTPIDTTTMENVAAEFGPGVSILYGTFVSITLSLLYQRQEDIQDITAQESSLLAMVARNLFTLFKKDNELIVDAGQCVADQVRTLSSGSRGEELMIIMYNDPYARMMELVEKLEDEWMAVPVDGDENVVYGRDDLLDKIRGTIQNLYELRASRLSNEALTLPSTHFFILTSLTALILLGYTVDILPTVTFTETGTAVPSFESSLLFGLLCTIYVLFHNYARDLNDPFGGVYQIKRASIVSHLMQIKSLIVNHPLLQGKVDFKGLREV